MRCCLIQRIVAVPSNTPLQAQRINGYILLPKNRRTFNKPLRIPFIKISTLLNTPDKAAIMKNVENAFSRG
jgi:hypothetical protein